VKQSGALSFPALALLAGMLVALQGFARVKGGQTPDTPAGLWRKAVETYRANEDCYPGRAAIVSEVWSGRKKLVSLTEMAFSFRPAARGRLRVELESSRRNGVDTTEKMRSKPKVFGPLKGLAHGDVATNSVSLSESPFDPGAQEGVSFASREERQTIRGRHCRRFDFTFRAAVAEDGVAQNVTWSGRAWLEEESGRPVRLEFSIAPLPPRFRRAWIVYDYETEQPDRWVVKSVTISGQGGILFIKRFFTVTTTFSDFRRN
jgi:hypothetical protein